MTGLPVVLLVFLVGGSTGDAKTVDTSCRDPWPKTSALCFHDDDPSVTAKGVTEEEREEIVREHNRYRSAVNPTAKQMLKMYWSEELEMTAQKYAQACKGGHDSFPNRAVPGWGIQIGQNAGWGYHNWSHVINDWHAEVEKFTYGGKLTGDTWKTIGHYTQVVRDVTVLIGCGFAMCGGVKKTYYCNYAHPNNYAGFSLPYVKGKPCEGCPDHCENNLCDCKGRQCLNGDLDPATCTCKCRNSYWTGDNCEVRVCDGLYCHNGGTINVNNCTCSCSSLLWKGTDCRDMDRRECRDKWYCKTHFKGTCKAYSNVPIECPKMCGVCTPDCDGLECVHGELDPRACTCACESQYWTGKDCGTEVCGGLRCENGGTLNKDECTCKCTSDLWIGKNCSEMDRGACKDKSACKTFFKGKCKVWSNTPIECPKMCGVCTPDCGGLECVHGELDPRACTCACESQYWTGKDCGTEVCGGLRCENGGTLNKDECTCKCTSDLWIGKNCSEMDRGACKDKSACKTFFKGKCKVWSNTPIECPKMCGVCTPDCGGLECVHGELDPRACTCGCESQYWTGKDCGTEVCGGLRCKNGAAFDPDKCECKCPKLYKGKDCSEIDPLQCKDMWACDGFYKGKCKVWSNVPGECPVSCGVCTPLEP